MNGTIAFFDFDGTVTKKDSLLEFIKYCKGTSRFYLGFAINAPFLIAYKLKIISNQRAKERMLRHFFGGTPAEVFIQSCKQFATEIIPTLIRPKALAEIKKLQQLAAEVVIVSASPGYWIQPWCEANGIGCIATQLEIKNNIITGNIEGRNCHGAEKVSRINRIYELQQYNAVYCYGDTPGDQPMLALGTIRFYKPFR